MHIGKTDDNKQIAVHNLQKQNNLFIELYYQHYITASNWQSRNASFSHHKLKLKHFGEMISKA